MYTAVVVQEVLQRDRGLEEEECSGRPLEVDNDQLSAIIKADLLTTTEVAEELSIEHSMVLCQWKQIEKVKKLDKWCALWVDHKSKKKIILKCCFLLFYATTLNHFSIGLLLESKSGFRQQPAMTSSAVATRKAPKHFPKTNLYQKKVRVTVWWFAADLICYSFLNTSKTITSEKYAQQIDETHQKL